MEKTPIETAARAALRAIEPVREGKRDIGTLARLERAEDDLLLALLHYDPAAYFLQHCESQGVIALRAGDLKGVEFWQRLRGNVRKAQTLQR